jgi:hypothetical protein
VLRLILAVVLLANAGLAAWPMLDASPDSTMSITEGLLTALLAAAGIGFAAVGLHRLRGAG